MGPSVIINHSYGHWGNYQSTDSTKLLHGSTTVYSKSLVSCLRGNSITEYSIQNSRSLGSSFIASWAAAGWTIHSRCLLTIDRLFLSHGYLFCNCLLFNISSPIGSPLFNNISTLMCLTGWRSSRPHCFMSSRALGHSWHIRQLYIIYYLQNRWLGTQAPMRLSSIMSHI